MPIYKIAKVFETTSDRHGAECRVVKTADLYDEKRKVIVAGRLAVLYNKDVFKHVKVGAEIELE